MAGNFFGIKGEILEEDHIALFELEVEEREAEAVAAWGEVAREAIKARETRVGDASPTRKVSPGVHLRDTFEVSRPKRELGGWAVWVFSRSPNARWQNDGTRKGVTPLKFMQNGMRDALRVAPEVIQRILSR